LRTYGYQLNVYPVGLGTLVSSSKLALVHTYNKYILVLIVLLADVSVNVVPKMKTIFLATYHRFNR
jgi:hypothetical protein